MTGKGILIALGILVPVGVVTAEAATKNARVPFDDIFTRHARKYRIPKRLAVSIVAHESGFNPTAVNHETAADKRLGHDVDSLGLGQILFPDTAHDFNAGLTREQLFDPDTNLEITCWQLGKMTRRYPVQLGDFPEDAVSAYNGGHSLRRQSGSFGNQDYIDAVRAQWEGYSDVVG